MSRFLYYIRGKTVGLTDEDLCAAGLGYLQTAQLSKRPVTGTGGPDHEHGVV